MSKPTIANPTSANPTLSNPTGAHPTSANPTLSSPSDPSQPLPPINPSLGLACSAAEHLIPLFATAALGSTPLARRMAISAVESYNPQSHPDFLNIARIIAFSMTALALLGNAAADDSMTMPAKMRAFSRANALNRSADQSERTMMQRRRYNEACLPAEPPDPQAAAEQAASDQAAHQAASDQAAELAASDAELTAAIREYLVACRTEAPPPETTPPEAASPPASTAAGPIPPQPPLTASAVQPPSTASAVQPPAVPAPPAIRYSRAGHDASRPQPTPFRRTLLSNSAMQRVTEQNSAQPTRPGPR